MMFSRFICTFSRNFSCSAPKIVPLPASRLQYTKNEAEKILEAVNQSSVEQLTKLNLSKARAQKVSLWISKHGPFKQVEQMLELDGFGEKVLQKFCITVLENGKEAAVTTSPAQNLREITRKVNQYCNPHLLDSTRPLIKSCLGVHISAGSISWAKLTIHENRPMTLDTWTDFKFDDGKQHLSGLAALTKQICEKMPIADTYVLEAPIASQPSLPGKNVVQLNVNVQKSQLIGMTALGLLYKPQETINPQLHGQQVFFVKNFLPARLFRTKVGSERISAENTVLDILRYHYNIEDKPGKVQDEGLLKQVNASDGVRKMFEKVEPYQRDLMGQAFLTALTFVRLCVQKCPQSLEKLEKRVN